MRILAIADEEERWLSGAMDRRRLEDIDLIISCGDLSAHYLEYIATIGNRPLAYVWGNHDTAYAGHPPEGCVDIDGQIRDFHGLRVLGLGGSMWYSERSHGYTEAEQRRRVARMVLMAQATGGIDVVVTHAPVGGYGDLPDAAHRGFTCFNTLVERLRPRVLLHGHVHMSYGRGVVRSLDHACGTSLVNAYRSWPVEIPDGEIPDRRSGWYLPVPKL